MAIAEYTLEYLSKADDLCSKLASAAATIVAEFENIKELGDDLLAECTANERILDDKISRIEAEERARGSQQWKDYQKGLCESRVKAAEAKVRVQNAQRLWDTVISGLAYRREEIKRSISS